MGVVMGKGGAKSMIMGVAKKCKPPFISSRSTPVVVTKSLLSESMLLDVSDKTESKNSDHPWCALIGKSYVTWFYLS
jgi:hypothetical protein